MTRPSLEDLVWWQAADTQTDSAAGVRLHTVWMNDVGIVALLSADSLASPADEALASLLRTISDAARQIQRSAPLLGLVIPIETDVADGGEQTRSPLSKAISRLAKNQAWHRGDFTIRSSESRESAEKFTSSILTPFIGRSPLARSIKLDLNDDDYARAIGERAPFDAHLAESARLLKAFSSGRSGVLEVIESLREETFSKIESAVGKSEVQNSHDTSDIEVER